MLGKLKKLNTDFEIYSINDDEFKKYGRVLNFDTSDIVKECGKIEISDDVKYLMSVDSLEKSSCSGTIREAVMGGCDVQIGICHGHNKFMNALEYHKSSEVNIAATPLILLLGLEYEMEKNEYDSKKVKGFFMEKGDAVEVYATSLHYCPCQVSGSGFSCVVALPKNTNGVLSIKSDDKLLVNNNKWLICHEGNEDLIKKGVYPGIHGKNHEVRY